MHVEEADLADDGGADEIVAGVYLGADFEAEAAGHAAGERVALFLNFGGDAWAFAEAVRAVVGDPGFYALEGAEQQFAIDGGGPADWEFCHRPDVHVLNGLVH